MAAAAALDSDDIRPDNAPDKTGVRSPSESLSPAPSSSPMPFLPAFESSFTPLSMHSEFDAPDGENGQGTPEKQEHTRTTSVSVTVPTAKHPVLSGHAPLSPPLDSVLYSARVPDTPSNHKSNQSANTSSAPASSFDRSPNATENNPLPGSGSAVSPRSARNPTEESFPAQITQQPIVVKPKPIVRTASTKSISLRHPIPDLGSRSASQASNIAQLEATAERLSMTSSIESAIRDLHEEQKRADSRRSSILAPSITSILETDEPETFPMSRQISIASSIREINTAARYGGYSPAGYVMSPNSTVGSSTTRLRSGSTGVHKPDVELSSSLSRHGPGKSSTRSIRSATKPALTNIAEIEPTALTAAAMDEADRLAEVPENDDHLRFSTSYDIDLTPNANEYHGSSNEHDYWNGATPDIRRDDPHDNGTRRTSAGSDGTFEQAERAFADFDGAHCSPDADFEELHFKSLFASPMADSFLPNFDFRTGANDQEAESSKPLLDPPTGLPTDRPQSYQHPESGETMLFYPARVPMMLNLPPKLSKKPKADVRNNRRSEMLSTLPSTNRQPVASWLPEYQSQPLLESFEAPAGDSTPVIPASTQDSPRNSPDHAQDVSHLVDESEGQVADSDHRESRIPKVNNDKRKSRIPDLSNLPPHLRASTYFELPSQSPTIQLKDGSATSTLDDILNASATAPVSAFTDHEFAGSLGAEVYGTNKKRKSHMKRASAADLAEPKTRNSIFHFRKPSALSRHSSLPGDNAKAESGAIDEERQGLSSAVDEGSGEEAEAEDEPRYNGPPTTLLAELQMRKQQQKQRTRPIGSAFPNGMHSTLLEIDTVAEIERKTRQSKKVNLAWEDPNANPAEEDDEETPLALLLATKGQDTGLINAIGDVNRPLGLMEQRDMEDNEPLSVRRNRLHGREAGPVQRMTLARGPNMSVSLSQPNLEVRAETPDGDEIEGETLAERMKRLRARENDSPLPPPRPVSSAFSVELLSQFEDAFKNKDEAGENKDEAGESKDAGKGKHKEGEQPTEEEETLGQRRRRLQAEREAREREMARAKLDGGRGTPQLTKRHSMADVLGQRNRKSVLVDPRVDAERTKQEEAARYKREQDQKFAALRQQIPSNLSAPNLAKPGGYMAGRYNDGTGGGLGQPRNSMAVGGFAVNSPIPGPAANASAMGNAFRAGGAMSTWVPPVANAYANAYGAPSPAQGGAQMDRVERWRQGVYP
ncbi:hypothetical protein GGS20DRAFT_551645 [Poronia punctata]|nr:hypothetical protein GGS20DRAFT_551645 [Poronia punctata]